MNVVRTSSPEETEEHGARLAKKCGAGSVIRLFGDLGSGKTLWVRGLARGFGLIDDVSSPSFTLMNCYGIEGFQLFHWDLYRLSPQSDWAALDFQIYLPSNEGVTVVEWPMRYPGPWPQAALMDVNFRIVSEFEREITTRILP